MNATVILYVHGKSSGFGAREQVYKDVKVGSLTSSSGITRFELADGTRVETNLMFVHEEKA